MTNSNDHDQTFSQDQSDQGLHSCASPIGPNT